MRDSLLSVENLQTHIFHPGARLRAVDDVSFTLAPGKTLGLVGESGAGKSMIGRSILRLVPSPARIVGGRIAFQGTDLLTLSEGEMRKIRGRDIAAIPQDPLASLNPAFRIRAQMTDVMQRHLDLSARESVARAVSLLARVGIVAPHEVIEKYPHQLSGGMRQRVMIAIAFACEPALIIADEPTSSLDVTTQAQIIMLLNEMKQKPHSAMIFITHDLGLAAKVCDEILVMYAGRIVERASAARLFTAPAHPYTRVLLRAVPRLDASPGELCSITGNPPRLAQIGAGCAFEPRCQEKHALGAKSQWCAQRAVPLVEVALGHSAACWQYAGEA